MPLSTFGPLKDALADWLSTTTSSTRWTDAMRGILINRAIRYMARKYDLRYNEGDQTIFLGAGQYTVALGATFTYFSRPYFVWYAHPQTGEVVRLDWKPRDEFDRLYPDPTKTGMPSHFTVFGPNARFGKTPEQDITIHFLHYYIPADLINNADSNAFTQEAWEAVLDRALVEATEYMVEDDRIDVWKTKWKDTEALLVMEHARARSMARVAQSVEPH